MKVLESTHILTRIVEAKRQRLERTKMRVPEEVVKHFALKAPAPPSFKEALQISKPVRVIAEVKKASPSKGVLSKDFSVAQLVGAYTESGAVAISVATEEDFFLGSLAWIGETRDKSPLPVLRKDYIFDPYQIFETRNAKASAIQLIVAMLEPDELRYFLSLAKVVGLDALVEVHDETELREALDAGAEIIGVNNRNLKTLEVDIQTAHRLAGLIPENCFFVVESGIRHPAEIDALLGAGADAFLIGEALVVHADPAFMLLSLQ